MFLFIHWSVLPYFEILGFLAPHFCIHLSSVSLLVKSNNAAFRLKAQTINNPCCIENRPFFSFFLFSFSHSTPWQYFTIQPGAFRLFMFFKTLEMNVWEVLKYPNKFFLLPSYQTWGAHLLDHTNMLQTVFFWFPKFSVTVWIWIRNLWHLLC